MIRLLKGSFEITELDNLMLYLGIKISVCDYTAPLWTSREMSENIFAYISRAFEIMCRLSYMRALYDILGDATSCDSLDEAKRFYMQQRRYNIPTLKLDFSIDTGRFKNRSYISIKKVYWHKHRLQRTDVLSHELTTSVLCDPLS